MEQKKIFVGMTFEDDAYYKYDGDILEVFLNKTVRTTSPEYFCTETTYAAHLDVAFLIEGKKNVTLDFGGATLYLRGAIQPFVFSRCENVCVKNVVVKYDRSYITEMVVTDAGVTESGEEFFRVKIDDKFTYKVENGQFFPYGTGWIETSIKEAPVFLQEFDGKTRRGVRWPVVLIGAGKDSAVLGWGDAVMGFGAYADGDGVVFRGKHVPPYKVGNVLSLTPFNRDISSVMLCECKDVSIENYRIVNGLGMGILTVYTENVVIDGLKFFMDGESDGFISNAADGIHSVATKGRFVLKNSVIEGTIDDALNIHGNFYEFGGADGNVMIARIPGKMNDYNRIFGAGDEIVVHRGHTVEDGERYKIVSAELVGKKTYSFTLDRPVAAHSDGDLIENLTAQPEILISGCRFGKANTHLRFQSRGKTVVENCESEMDFIFTGDTNYWFESSPVTDVTIRNVSFDRESAAICSIPEFKATPAAPYYHSGIRVENCSFTSRNALYMRYTDKMTFVGNSCSAGGKFSFFLDNCGSLETDCDADVKRVSTKSSRDE